MTRDQPKQAIWRHVRLKKGFSNIEPLSQGGFKLKIPHELLAEKRRTQNRFQVPPLYHVFYWTKMQSVFTIFAHLLRDMPAPPDPPQIMRQKSVETLVASKEKRSTSIMSKRIAQIVDEIIVPMRQTPEKLPSRTKFSMTEYDICMDFFQNLCRECPRMTNTRQTFLDAMRSVYEQHMSKQPPHA